MNLNELPDMTTAYQEVQEKKKAKEDGKKSDRWQDDDGDGKWYEKSDVDGKISDREKKEKKKNQKEEVEVDEKISASGYARAKKWREDQARAKDKKEQEYYANKAKTHKWDGEKWNKKESVEYDDIESSIDEVVKQLRDSGLFSEEELARLDEISADKLMKASKAADVARGKKAVAGDKEGAKKEVKRASKFYAASAAKRKQEKG